MSKQAGDSLGEEKKFFEKDGIRRHTGFHGGGGSHSQFIDGSLSKLQTGGGQTAAPKRMDSFLVCSSTSTTV